MTTLEQLREALTSLSPSHLDIRDDSALHAGHAGNNGGGHYRVTIVSDAFSGLSLIKRHRLVYQAADHLMPEAIHALSIQAQSPDEFVS